MILTTSALIESIQVEQLSYAAPGIVLAILIVLSVGSSVTWVLSSGQPGGNAVLLSLLGIFISLCIATGWIFQIQQTQHKELSSQLTEQYGIPINVSFNELAHVSKALDTEESYLLPFKSSTLHVAPTDYDDATGEYRINQQKEKLLEGLTLRITGTSISLMWTDGDTYKPFTVEQRKVLTAHP